MNPDRFFVIQFLFFMLWAAALLWVPFFRPPPPVPVQPVGAYTGTVRSATTGQVVQGARFEVRAGSSAPRANPTLQAGPVSFAGSFSVRQPAGPYTVHFDAAGYESEARLVTLTPGGSINRDMFMMPKVPEGSLRIRLTWAAEPADIDLHVTGPGQNNTRYNVYFAHRFDRTSTGLTVGLDRDDTDSYGPETTTVPLSPGTLKVFVHNWTDRAVTSGPLLSRLGRSEAVVDVYSARGHQGRWTIDPRASGTLWSVLSIDGTTGAITPVNTYSVEPNVTRIQDL